MLGRAVTLYLTALILVGLANLAALALCVAVIVWVLQAMGVL